MAEKMAPKGAHIKLTVATPPEPCGIVGEMLRIAKYPCNFRTIIPLYKAEATTV
jgi:hypothetical protein